MQLSLWPFQSYKGGEINGRINTINWEYGFSDRDRTIHDDPTRNDIKIKYGSDQQNGGSDWGKNE